MDQHQPTPNRGHQEAAEAAAIEPQGIKTESDASAEGDGSKPKPKPGPKAKAQPTLLPFLPPPVIGSAWVQGQQSQRDAREAQARSGSFTTPATASGQPIHGWAIPFGSLPDSAPEAAAGDGDDDNDMDISSFVNLDTEGQSS